ncbi:unnamed protein product [Arctogadus glacialis]
MIHHGMNLVKKNTEHLNPQQVPVMVVDQPLYDLAKKMQWTFPDIFGEDKFVVMLENPDMLERWIVTGPEISRVLEEFTTVNDSDDSEWRPHHEEGSASQQRFQRHTKDLMELLLSNGNPFEESSKDLVTLDNKVCESAAAAASVLKVESMGQEQYNNFKKNVLDSHDTPLTAPIKRNNLMLFS